MRKKEVMSGTSSLEKSVVYGSKSLKIQFPLIKTYRGGVNIV